MRISPTPAPAPAPAAPPNWFCAETTNHAEIGLPKAGACDVRSECERKKKGLEGMPIDLELTECAPAESVWCYVIEGRSDEELVVCAPTEALCSSSAARLGQLDNSPRHGACAQYDATDTKESIGAG